MSPLSIPAIAPTPDGPLRVAASPGWHPYFRPLAADVAVDQLRRPPIGYGEGEFGDDWAASLPEDVTVVHVLSNGPIGSMDAVTTFIDHLDARDLPFVLTLFDVHDRDVVDPSRGNPRLDALVGRADALTTLTAAGARAARQRWNRDAVVVGHPHVAPFGLIEEVAADRLGGPTSLRRAIGVPVSSATGRTVSWEAATALVDVLETRNDVRVELLPVDDDVLDVLVDHPLLARPRVRVLAGTRMDEDRLLRWLGQLDHVLLPYRHATHSGWLPLCQDLAVGVVSVADPAMLEMGLTVGYEAGDTGVVDADDIATALHRALDTAIVQPDVRRRRTRLRAIREAHRTVYALATRNRRATRLTARLAG